MRRAYAAALAAALSMLGTEAVMAAGLTNENLLVPLPNDFQLGDTASHGPQSLTEYVPKGETVDNWSRMITVQILRNAGNRNGAAFAANLANSWRVSCPGGDGAKAGAGTENGYPFTLWVFECPLNPATKKPETIFLKTIIGQDSLYDVQYAYRQEAAAALVTQETTYLATVKACDTRVAARACPKGM